MRACEVSIAAIGFTCLLPLTGRGEDKLPSLIDTLRSSDVNEQLRGLGRAERLGLDAISAIPNIAPLLRHRDQEVQACAARALAAMRRDAAPAIPGLIALLAATPTPWQMTDVGGVPEPGNEAVLALAAVGPDAVAPLTTCLEDRNPVIRFQAAVALGKIGPVAKEAAPAVRKLLDDPAPAVRLQATWSLLQLAPHNKQAIEAVIEKMKDHDRDVRATTADVLNEIRPASKVLIDTLVEALEDKETAVQAHAARTLGKLGPASTAAVPALTRLLKSRGAYSFPDGHPYPGLERPVAMLAAEALGQIGPSARSAMPSLLQLIGDTEGTYEVLGVQQINELARAAAAKAAAKIDPLNQQLVGVLRDALRKDASTRDQTAWALAMIGPKAISTREDLLELLRTEESGRLAFACAVLRMDKNESATFEVLLKELTSGESVEVENWDVLRQILHQFDPTKKQSVAALVKYLEGDHAHEDVCCALQTLASYGSQASPALPMLERLLYDEWDDVHIEVVVTMWRISPDPKRYFQSLMRRVDEEARPRILAALHGIPDSSDLIVESLTDRSANVRFAALSALQPDLINKHQLQRVRELQRDPCRSIQEAATNLVQIVSTLPTNRPN